MASVDWVKFNEDAKAPRWRRERLEKRGGEFVHNSKGEWVWVAPTKKPVSSTPKRAREKRGRYAGDNPATPDVNEAWVGGKSPVTKKGSKDENI